ncbi:MAG: hypothetical protein PHN84_14350 [Desulfuromonadaceae bacterium]|nr:hypothetical protein [Desulfuromonadaceae bacterium]MDD2855323.1 hypothetical protein [Desulfuromonadaceae bacterium]
MTGVWESTGKKPALLEDEPEFYPAVEHLWQWFQELSGTRGGGFGPAPLTYAEIAAWQRVMQTHPTPWEIAIIKHLDNLYFKYLADKRETEKED